MFYAPDLLQKDVYDYGATITEYIPTMEGYTFDGWYADADPTEPYVLGAIPADEVILFAKWIAS